MAPTESLSPELALQKFCDQLNNLQWSVDGLDSLSEMESQVERYLLGLSDQKYGRELSETEETYERSRWLRSQCAQLNMRSYDYLFSASYNYVSNTANDYRMDALGELAGLVSASDWSRPSPQIRFQSSVFPETPALSINEYESQIGGPHVFGARLLWWCAAAASPQKFGYPFDFKLQLVNQPFWFQDGPSFKCSFNKRTLELLYATANRISNSSQLKLHNEKMKEENTLDQSENGPLPGNEFHYNGKTVSLTKNHSKALAALWNSKGKKLLLSDFKEVIWGDNVMGESTTGSLISKLNTQLQDQKLYEFEVKQQADLVVLTISDSTTS